MIDVPPILYKHPQNNWFWSNSRERLYSQIYKAIREMSWLSLTRAKYLTIRMDMRTGSFLLLDQNGDVLDDESIKKLLKCHINTLPMLDQEERNDHPKP